MVGYATIYTMFPVFSLVLDKDLDSRQAMMYPELYKDLTKGRSLTYKTFFVWILISLYQGGYNVTRLHTLDSGPSNNGGCPDRLPIEKIGSFQHKPQSKEKL